MTTVGSSDTYIAPVFGGGGGRAGAADMLESKGCEASTLVDLLLYVLMRISIYMADVRRHRLDRWRMSLESSISQSTPIM
jgi:hypothetical protein